MHLSTDEYSLSFSAEGDVVWVEGDEKSLECFRQTVELAGHSEGLAGASRVFEGLRLMEGSRGPENGIQTDRGTVSLFLSFEVLNYL